jgi:hypothetical protein
MREDFRLDGEEDTAMGVWAPPVDAMFETRTVGARPLYVVREVLPNGALETSSTGKVDGHGRYAG